MHKREGEEGNQFPPESQGSGYKATFLGNLSTLYQLVNSLMSLKLAAETRHCLSAGEGAEKQTRGHPCRVQQSDWGEEADVTPGVGSTMCPVCSAQVGEVRVGWAGLGGVHCELVVERLFG